MTDALLTVRETAALLRLGADEVRELVRRGELEHCRPGTGRRRIRIFEASVRRHIERRTVRGDAGADLGGLKWVRMR